MKRIVLIIPYFGNLRNDFYFWLKSVEYNSTVDFFIFTDQDIIDPPKNVKVFKMNFCDMQGLVRKNVYYKSCIPCAYKLCDYKPAYGELFRDYIGDYDFWGHCDCDLVFGNIRKFITDDILDEYDRILTRGHLTLYRNTPEINSRYKEVLNPSYFEVFSNLRIYAFDEWPGTSKFWSEKYKTKLYDAIIFDDIAPYVYSFFSVQKKDDKYRKNFMFSYDRGNLYRYYEQDGVVCREETLYVHFQKRRLLVTKKLSIDMGQFTILPNKYVPFEKNVTIGYLRKKVRTSVFWAYMERFYYRLDKILGVERGRAYLTLSNYKY